MLITNFTIEVWIWIRVAMTCYFIFDDVNLYDRSTVLILMLITKFSLLEILTKSCQEILCFGIQQFLERSACNSYIIKISLAWWISKVCILDIFYWVHDIKSFIEDIIWSVKVYLWQVMMLILMLRRKKCSNTFISSKTFSLHLIRITITWCAATVHHLIVLYESLMWSAILLILKLLALNEILFGWRLIFQVNRGNVWTSLQNLLRKHFFWIWAGKLYDSESFRQVLVVSTLLKLTVHGGYDVDVLLNEISFLSRARQRFDLNRFIFIQFSEINCCDLSRLLNFLIILILKVLSLVKLNNSLFSHILFRFIEDFIHIFEALWLLARNGCLDNGVFILKFIYTLHLWWHFSTVVGNFYLWFVAITLLFNNDSILTILLILDSLELDWLLFCQFWYTSAFWGTTVSVVLELVGRTMSFVRNYLKAS